MASRELSRSIWRAVDALGSRPRFQCERTIAIRQAQRSVRPQISRCISTTTTRRAKDTEDVTEEELREPFAAAPEIEFESTGGSDEDGGKNNVLRTLRVVPASPSYFSAKPTFTDDFLSLSALLRSVATLPIIPPAEAPKVAWNTIEQYRIMTNEPVKTARYHRMLQVLRRLNCIHPTLMPDEVVQAMLRYKKPNQPGDIKPKPGIIDELGRSKGVGRRKTSSAVAWLVEGEGEVLVNGKSLSQYFGRLHHRESAVWALKATSRLDKYNVFALVEGGGLTGQAEAMTLAVAKSLLVHEPALKPAVRRGESRLFSFPGYIRVGIASSVVPCMCPNWALSLAHAYVHVSLFKMALEHPSLSHLHDLNLIANYSQRVQSLVIRGRWRGRSLVTSRRARCLPGSSVELPMCILYLYRCICTVSPNESSISDSAEICPFCLSCWRRSRIQDRGHVRRKITHNLV
jgi:small subunit ribosomal protein S9